LFASVQSTVQRVRADFVSGAVRKLGCRSGSGLCLASRHAKMMDEIDLRRKRRSELAASDLA
jgi:hypothetical protein